MEFPCRPTLMACGRNGSGGGDCLGLTLGCRRFLRNVFESLAMSSHVDVGVLGTVLFQANRLTVVVDVGSVMFISVRLVPAAKFL